MRRGQTPSPRFFVSVASKGFSVSVSGLESTFMDGFLSVDSKGVATKVFEAQWWGGNAAMNCKIGHELRLTSTTHVNTSIEY